MLLGDPFAVSVMVKSVKEWNDYGDHYEPLNGGIMIITVDGFMFPFNEVLNVSLNCAIPELINNLKGIPYNEDIFKLEDKKSAFKEIYDLVYYNHIHDENDGIEEDWRYKVSPTEFLDHDFLIFAVSNGTKVRFLALKVEYIKSLSLHNLDDIAVREVFVTHAEIDHIINGLEDWLKYYLSHPIVYKS